MTAQKYRKKVDRLHELNKKELADLSDEEIMEFLETRKELVTAFEPLIETMVGVTKRIANLICDIGTDLSKWIEEDQSEE